MLHLLPAASTVVRSVGRLIPFWWSVTLSVHTVTADFSPIYECREKTVTISRFAWEKCLLKSIAHAENTNGISQFLWSCDGTSPGTPGGELWNQVVTAAATSSGRAGDDCHDHFGFTDGRRSVSPANFIRWTCTRRCVEDGEQKRRPTTPEV